MARMFYTLNEAKAAPGRSGQPRCARWSANAGSTNSATATASISWSGKLSHSGLSWPRPPSKPKPEPDVARLPTIEGAGIER